MNISKPENIKLAESALSRAQLALSACAHKALHGDGPGDGIELAEAIGEWESVLTVAAEIILRSNVDAPEPSDAPVRAALLARAQEHEAGLLKDRP